MAYYHVLYINLTYRTWCVCAVDSFLVIVVVSR